MIYYIITYLDAATSVPTRWPHWVDFTLILVCKYVHTSVPRFEDVRLRQIQFQLQLRSEAVLATKICSLREIGCQLWWAHPTTTCYLITGCIDGHSGPITIHLKVDSGAYRPSLG